MNEPVFYIKRDVVYSKNKDELRILKDHYLDQRKRSGQGGF